MTEFFSHSFTERFFIPPKKFTNIFYFRRKFLLLHLWLHFRFWLHYHKLHILAYFIVKIKSS